MSDQELAVATALSVDRLRERGARIDGDEDGDEVVTLLEAVERFQGAVQSHGGDLMVDEPPPGNEAQPDDPDFVLPERRDGELVPDYIVRIDAAARRINERLSDR